MPRLNLEDSKKLEWLRPHIALQLSNRELDIRNGDSATKLAPINALVNVKQSIRTLVANCSGTQGTKTRVFSFSEADSSRPSAILLVSSLRLDLASFTVVVDGALVPVSTERASSLASSIEKLQKEDSTVRVVTNGQETVVWKSLFPAFVERCRTWSHNPNCEYATRGGTPLIANTGENLICSCGTGVGFEALEQEAASWKDLLPFATRVAISPLFPVSFVEYGSRYSQTAHSSQPVMSGDLARPQRRSDDACWVCGGVGYPTLATCSRCKKARYCSGICQTLDWKAHKTSCRKA
ncbi:hypothetical protein FS749_013216 [Ceratobasidium sp. UAMH 11750]|nr:hypothetical protein FS749_013216 [Ceratobasidium sp. UAMH 11750]